MTLLINEFIKFSVLVPVYQVEEYIDECIQSIINQTYCNWELILVDDGSKDKSGEICDKYAEKYDNIYVYHKENRGLMHTRRYGIARATGDYCIFLDSDDWLETNALEVIFHTIQKHSCECVIYGYDRVFSGKIIGKSAHEEECCITDKKELYRKCLLSDNYNGICRKAVKMTVFKETDYSPYFHIQLAEDLLQSLEILEGSSKIAFIDDRLYKYRLNFASITGNLKVETQKDSFAVRQRVLDFLEEQGVFEEKELDEFRRFTLRAICSYIATISCSDNLFSRKVELFNELKVEELYRRVLPYGAYDKKKVDFRIKLILELFLRDHYMMLVGLSLLYRFLESNYRKLKVTG